MPSANPAPTPTVTDLMADQSQQIRAGPDETQDQHRAPVELIIDDVECSVIVRDHGIGLTAAEARTLLSTIGANSDSLACIGAALQRATPEDPCGPELIGRALRIAELLDERDDHPHCTECLRRQRPLEET